MSFFTLSAEKARIVKKTSSLTKCGACGLFKNCRTPKMSPVGRGSKKILILGESSSQAEDQGKEGEASAYLRGVLKRYGVDLAEDCWKLNAIGCKADSAEGPTDSQVEYCRPRVLNAIEELSPKVIIVLGGAAMKSLLSHRWFEGIGGINKWRGWTAPDRDLSAWVCPTYHPVYVMRMKKEPVIEKIFRDDIDRAISMLDENLPSWKDEKESIHILDSPRQVAEKLAWYLQLSPMYLAFDYETTGLKPHAEGHRIVSCSFSLNGNDADVWMWKDMDKYCLEIYRKIMENHSIGKIASNIKYEDNWTYELVNCKIAGWVWDTMIGGHVLENRQGACSIKFLAYVHLGVVPWNNDVEGLLHSPKELGANAFNRIDEIDPYDLMIYNGLDSIYEFQEAVLQMGATV